ncbi:hypothetical protein T459_08710 [Capsicum annuum]|uniref:Fe2OG dioxygenase domain-containing protein n=1 Tax=Capsicum annuum TaxID=4072 RepID=A0A2G2ZXB0_CAPAN|nr:hypothetical protein T459_08710 [Capsicum annuum]
MMPSSQRPSLKSEFANVPVVDLADMHDGNPLKRSMIILDIAKACRRNGFFQLSVAVTFKFDGALSAAFDFFELPTEGEEKFISNDVYKSIRYGTSLKDGEDKVQFWRVFIKHHANPLNDWIELWPENPQEYREKKGKYAKEVQKLAIKIMGMITEGQGLGPRYLSQNVEDGMTVIAVNCYSPCPQPGLALGLPPHSDYNILTITLQSSVGLEILDTQDNEWRVVQDLHGTLQVHVGDHLEVVSSGLYKSEDPQLHLEEVRKIMQVMLVSEEESVELVSYRLKDIAYDWDVLWRKGRGDNAAPMTWQGSMTVMEYCLKFNQLAKYAPDLISDTRASMSKFVTDISGLVLKECRTAILYKDMDLARLMMHAQ